MPVVIPKPPPPIKPPELKPVDLSAPQAPGLTRAEVEAMLAARDAAWERRLAALALTLAPQPAPQPAAPPPRKGADIVFHRNTRGEITGAAIVPKE